MSAIIVVIYLAVVVFEIAALWKVFVKAGQPGWAAIIPIYNLYILTKIARRPGWWVLLFFIPLVNLVMAFIVWIDVAKAFGRNALFGVGLTILGIIFVPILGFGSDQYGTSSPAYA